MKIDFVYPKSELLKKYIACFSFVRSEKDVEAEYLMYPNVTTIFSLSKSTQLKIKNNYIKIEIDPNLKSIQSDITGRFLSPLHFHYKGKFDEINLVFQPLGFAHFFLQPFLDAAPKNYQLFRPEFKDWTYFTEQLFEIEEMKNRVDFLETYLLGKFIEPDLEKLPQVVAKLLDIEEKTSIKDISFEAGIHQKKLERLSQKHLGCSAATFRRIARFRHSINLRLAEDEFKKLTRTSYQSNFADQSHFIKEFRRLSKMSPKDFFGSTRQFPEHNIVLKVL